MAECGVWELCVDGFVRIRCLRRLLLFLWLLVVTLLLLGWCKKREKGRESKLIADYIKTSNGCSIKLAFLGCYFWETLESFSLSHSHFHSQSARISLEYEISFANLFCGGSEWSGDYHPSYCTYTTFPKLMYRRVRREREAKLKQKQPHGSVYWLCLDCCSNSYEPGTVYCSPYLSRCVHKCRYDLLLWHTCIRRDGNRDC